MKLPGNLRWAAVVLAAVLVVMAIGCSGEPEVIVKEVQVVVTATPAPTPVPAPAPTSTVVPTPEPPWATPTPLPTSRPATPVPTPTPVWDDYYVLMRYDRSVGWGSVEVFADFPSENYYTAERGGGGFGFSNPGTLLDHMLKGGAITSGQRQAYDRGVVIKVSLRDFAVVLYRLCEARGYVERGQDARIDRDEVIVSCSANISTLYT